MKKFDEKIASATFVLGILLGAVTTRIIDAKIARKVEALHRDEISTTEYDRFKAGFDGGWKYGREEMHRERELEGIRFRRIISDNFDQ